MRVRDIPAAVALIDREVDWANGQDGGHVHGREAVRAYWTQQWAAIQPKVDPLEITPRDAGVTAVEVHQVVQDLDGVPLWVRNTLARIAGCQTTLGLPMPPMMLAGWPPRPAQRHSRFAASSPSRKMNSVLLGRARGSFHPLRT